MKRSPSAGTASKHPACSFLTAARRNAVKIATHNPFRAQPRAPIPRL
ncbi:MAG: hypothetical protein IPL99_18675 [Candidatus Competibacteraceae bacterium]|nr:hypothetical protein [Candidatus Competibacteraceae bacterium]